MTTTTPAAEMYAAAREMAKAVRAYDLAIAHAKADLDAAAAEYNHVARAVRERIEEAAEGFRGQANGIDYEEGEDASHIEALDAKADRLDEIAADLEDLDADSIGLPDEARMPSFDFRELKGLPL